MEDLWVGYTVSSFSAYIGILIGAKVRGNKRGILGNIVLGIFWGFVAALLTLMVNMMGYDDAYYDNIVVGVIYGFIMENVNLEEGSGF